MTHSILRHYLHLDLEGTEAQGLVLQRSLPDLCRDSVFPALERIFNGYGQEDRYLSIERLELDVGTLSFERLEEELAKVAAQALDRSLRKLLPHGVRSAPTTTGKVVQQTESQRLEEAFVYFLEHGWLPWSFQLEKGKTLEQSLFLAWQGNRASQDFSRMPRELVCPALQSTRARKRLVRQFSDSFLKALLTQLSPQVNEAVSEVRQALGKASLPSDQVKLCERIVWEVAFAHVAVGSTVTVGELVHEVVHALPLSEVQAIQLRQVFEQRWLGMINPTDAIYSSTDQRPHLHVSTSAHLLPNLRDVPETDHPDLREGIYIDNAGLVLLHPFLPQLFGALKIADGDRIVQPPRALALLHFLATGRTEAPEYEFVLPKLLCGLPIEAPVEWAEAVTLSEQEEAMGLLEALVSHWTVLRNTSPDGLRGTFLLRKGKVSMQDDGEWVLQVEAQTVDILLDQLPWGISTIKLPWMNKIIWVEWR